jgi:hypothetical protein
MPYCILQYLYHCLTAFIPIEMAAKLDSITLELATIIGDHLEATSLSSLRLVSKRVKRQFTPNFLPFLQFQAIDLTKLSLERLCELAVNDELSSAVRSLRFTCLHFVELEESSGEFVELTM